MEPKRPTLRDVAREAGVSVTTASRALARRGDVTPATRARVAAAAASLDYDRAWTKQGRPSQRPLEITLIVAHRSEWTDRVMRGAWHAAANLGFDLNIKLERADHDEDWPRRISQSQCAGVIFGLVHPLRSEVHEIRSAGIPVVVVGPITELDPAAYRVEATDWEGGFLAGQHLARAGASQFVSVLGRPAYPFGQARQAGFQAAISKYAPRAHVTRIDTEWTAEGPLEELSVLLQRRTAPIAVFACNDAIALRCYESAHEVGAHIGRDVLIVGFDDGPHAALAKPPLTTLHQPLEVMAARAVNAIADAARGLEPDLRALPVHLVVRSSTRCHSQSERNPRG